MDDENREGLLSIFVFESEAFTKAESAIDELYRAGDGNLSAPAKKLLKDGE
jgi:hypothetical protein